MPLFFEALKWPGRQRSEGSGSSSASERPAHRGHLCFVALEAWPVLSRVEHVERIGGAEVQQCTLARALVREGYKVSMITLDHGQPDGAVYDGITCYKAYAPEAGVKVLRFVHPRLTSLLLAMRRADADVYYVRGADMLAGVVAEFCRLHNRRSLFAGASDLDFMPGRKNLRYGRDRWLYAHGLKRVDAIVVQNPTQYRDCLGHYGREAKLIPSCYAPPAGAKANRQGSILWVSTLQKNKRPELFLELARRLPHRRFVMAGGPGSGEERQRYYDSIRSEASGLPNVEFLGFVPLAKVEGYFDQARVFVNTSRYEGFPNTFLQAWARGIPTAAFVDTGSREGTVPVYPVVNTLEQLQAEVERLMGDDAHWQEASERCRRCFGANHSVAITMRRYRNMLVGLLPAFTV